LSSGKCLKKEVMEKAEMLLTGQFNKLTGFAFTGITSVVFNSTGTLLFVGDTKVRKIDSLQG
jgi:hypothetical protein